MVRFKTRFQALENFYRVRDRGFIDINFLEAPREGVILFKNAPVFGIGGCANAF